MSIFSGLFGGGSEPAQAADGGGGAGLFSSSNRYRRQLPQGGAETGEGDQHSKQQGKKKKKEKTKVRDQAAAAIAGKETEKAAKRARGLPGQQPPEVEAPRGKKPKKGSSKRAGAEDIPTGKSKRKVTKDEEIEANSSEGGEEGEEDPGRLVHETLLGTEKRPVGKAAAAAAGKSQDPQNDAEGQPSEAAHDRDDVTNTLFVGNVPLTITRKALMKLFKAHGEVKSVRIRSLPVKVDSTMSRKAATITGTTAATRSSTNAYVVMATSEGAKAALSLNMSQLEGKHIRVDSAMPRSGTDDAEGTGVSYDPARTIFIGNLHFEVETEEIIGAIEMAASKHPELRGSLDAVRVVRDAEKSICKGFGFIMFKTKVAARAALSLKGVEVHGRELRVTRLKAGPPGKKDRSDPALRGASKGVAKRSKQESWQGTRVKAGSTDMKAKKMRRGASEASGRSAGGQRSRGSAKAQAAAGTGGAPREKGKRPAVLLKKMKQEKERDATALGGGQPPKKASAWSPKFAAGKAKGGPKKSGTWTPRK